MVKPLDSTKFEEKFYPSSDGKPMAENTLQFEWITKTKLNLEKTTANQNIFVAGDLLWYPVKGNNKIRVAPDVMVAIGRPKGHRSSYLQWREGNIAPQVVFEILSPSNTIIEMAGKLAFYNRYKVEEYYIYDPQKNNFTIYQKNAKHLEEQLDIRQWTSPHLGIHFNWTVETLELFHPDGAPFLTFMELEKLHADAIEALKESRQKFEKERLLLERERQINEKLREEKKQEKEARKRAEEEKRLLIEKLKALGIDIDNL